MTNQQEKQINLQYRLLYKTLTTPTTQTYHTIQEYIQQNKKPQ